MQGVPNIKAFYTLCSHPLLRSSSSPHHPCFGRHRQTLVGAAELQNAYKVYVDIFRLNCTAVQN